MGTTLTEKDIKKFINDIYNKDYIKPRDKKTGRFLPGKKVYKGNTDYIIYCGSAFKEQFDKVIQEQYK